jgi:hypothetical protein
LDHVPSIFGFDNIQNLSSQVKNKKSFKEATHDLNTAIRNLSNDIIHSQAHKKEEIKITKQTIDNQNGNIDLFITGIIEQINTDDKRPDYPVARISTEIKEETPKEVVKIDNFKKYIQKGIDHWEEKYINDKKIYIYKNDELYQIHIDDDNEDFSEPWTQVYPDQGGSGKYSVHLVYNNNIIEEITFIYCDGARIHVAMPFSLMYCMSRAPDAILRQCNLSYMGCSNERDCSYQ